MMGRRGPREEEIKGTRRRGIWGEVGTRLWVPLAELGGVVVGHLVDPGSGLIRLSKCGDSLSLDNESNGARSSMGDRGSRDNWVLRGYEVGDHFQGNLSRAQRRRGRQSTTDQGRVALAKEEGMSQVDSLRDCP